MSDFQKCLDAKKIIALKGIEIAIDKELNEAEKDLSEAKDRFEAGKYKYAITTGYYALFHAARSLLYSEGYREKSHHCLKVAIEELFVNKKRLASNLTR